MSLLSQARLLLPLFEAIRNHLGPDEYANLKVATCGAPCIEAHTGRGSMIVTINEDGMYAFDTAGSLYTCDTNSKQDDVCNVIRRALNDAREEWA